MSRHGMQEVDLEDAQVVADAPVDDVSHPRRMRWWWAVGVAVVAAATLVVTQTVLDARERAVLARFAAVPGVVAPVDSSVQVLWSPSEALSGLVLGGVPSDGAFVGLSITDDGAQEIVSVDERTGDVRWSTSMFGPDASLALSLDRRSAGRCAPSAEHQIACLVSNGFQHFDKAGSPTVVPPTITRVVVVDTRDGSVVADHETPAATSMAVLRGLAVLSTPGAEVAARDLLTGELRWRYTPPSAGEDLSQAAFTSAVQVFGAGDLVGVTNPGWSVALLNASGDLVRAPIPALAGYRYGATSGTLALLSTTGSGQVRSTLVRTGRDDVDLPGTYLDVTVDDGSVPDLVLTSDAALRGWDARTGARRWSSDEVAAGSALVLQGRVYVPTMTGTVALDARTGETVWRSALTPGHVPGTLVTDGSALLVADDPVAGPQGSQIVAYDLDDGHALWTAPLPDGVRSSTAVDHTLLGLTTAGVVVLG